MPKDYAAFIDSVEGIVRAQDRVMIGWEEIAQAPIDPGTIVQHWRSGDLALAGAAKGAHVLMSPSTRVYLDMKYDPATTLGQNWANYIDVDTAYVWDPLTRLPGLSGEQVLGIVAPLWTETVATWDDAEFLLFPRLPAIAEVAWSPADDREWDEFSRRLGRHGARMTAMGIHFYRSPRVPVGGRVSQHTTSEHRSVTAPSDRVAKILALPDPHAWTGSVPSWLGDPSQRGIGQFIDHTLLKPEATPAEIDHAAQVARELGTATVCINGRWVERVRKALEGSTVKTCAVVGFPLGAMASKVKADEARQAIADGAVELDMVMSLGEAKAGHWDLVAKDVEAVIAAAGKVPVKVILETALLSPEEIVQASLMAVDAGAAFVKTSSGFHGAGGAMEPAVRLMRRTVGATFGVKASGGVRTSEMAIRFLAAGANRLGMSSTGDVAAIIGPRAPTLTELFAALPDPAPAPPGY